MGPPAARSSAPPYSIILATRLRGSLDSSAVACRTATASPIPLPITSWPPQGPTLVITADNGSSDQPRIGRLAVAGIGVGGPRSARPGCHSSARALIPVRRGLLEATPGPAGLRLEIADIDRFAHAFDLAVRTRLADRQLGAIIWTDGDLAGEDTGLDGLAALDTLEPVGRGFEARCSAASSRSPRSRPWLTARICVWR